MFKIPQTCVLCNKVGHSCATCEYFDEDITEKMNQLREEQARRNAVRAAREKRQAEERTHRRKTTPKKSPLPEDVAGTAQALGIEPYPSLDALIRSYEKKEIEEGELIEEGEVTSEVSESPLSGSQIVPDDVQLSKYEPVDDVTEEEEPEPVEIQENAFPELESEVKAEMVDDSAPEVDHAKESEIPLMIDEEIVEVDSVDDEHEMTDNDNDLYDSILGTDEVDEKDNSKDVEEPVVEPEVPQLDTVTVPVVEKVESVSSDAKPLVEASLVDGTTVEEPEMVQDSATEAEPEKSEPTEPETLLEQPEAMLDEPETKPEEPEAVPEEPGTLLDEPEGLDTLAHDEQLIEEPEMDSKEDEPEAERPQSEEFDFGDLPPLEGDELIEVDYCEPASEASSSSSSYDGRCTSESPSERSNSAATVEKNPDAKVKEESETKRERKTRWGGDGKKSESRSPASAYRSSRSRDRDSATRRQHYVRRDYGNRDGKYDNKYYQQQQQRYNSDRVRNHRDYAIQQRYPAGNQHRQYHDNRRQQQQYPSNQYHHNNHHNNMKNPQQQQNNARAPQVSIPNLAAISQQLTQLPGIQQNQAILDPQVLSMALAITSTLQNGGNVGNLNPLNQNQNHVNQINNSANAHNNFNNNRTPYQNRNSGDYHRNDRRDFDDRRDSRNFVPRRYQQRDGDRRNESKPTYPAHRRNYN